MSVIEMINTLVSQGHKVGYYKRKDGSYRISNIDGTHYSGSTGNKVARWLLGEKLSEARGRQLQSIKTPKGKWGHKKKEPLPEDLEKKLKTLQRKWRAKGKKKGDQGMPSKRGLRWSLEHEGYELARTRLIENEKYLMGIAYTKNVEWLVQRIRREQMAGKRKDEWQELINYILENKETFKEDWISVINDILYDSQMSEQDKLQKIWIIIA